MSAAKRVRKAVIPAAGFGTRFLPFTKSVPKELIPLVDKPVLQYVVEEAVASGIEEILLVVSTDKEAIIRHFNPVPELEKRLAERGKNTMLDELRAISKLAKISYTYQQELNGLGDAVSYAEPFVGDEPFAVLLGDTVMKSSTAIPVTAQLVETYEKYGNPVIAVAEVPLEQVSRYGIVGGVALDENAVKIDTMVEKPASEVAPSRLAVAARYVLVPEIFTALRSIPRGKDNELQLTDAMHWLLARGTGFCGRKIQGKRYDIGSKMGFLKGTVEFALERPEFRDEFMAFLKKITEG